MSNIDWSKAPWDATHYAAGLPESDIVEVWCKKDNAGNWLFSNMSAGGVWSSDPTPDDESRYIPRTSTTSTLETMLTEWRDLEARAQAAQAEADALFEHAGQCHGEVVVRLAELGWGAPRVRAEVVAPVSNEWIEWKGGRCPVAYGTEVDYKLRCDGNDCGPEQAYRLRWDHRATPADIVAYRLSPSTPQ